MIKHVLLAVSLLVFGAACSAAGDTAKTYVAGKDYDVISPPVRSIDPAKIEVAEFFWYGCSHCFAFEPMLEAWKKTLPDDVKFRGIPAMWRAPMDLHAKAYYTAEALGVLDTMHPVLFQTMNVERKPLASQAEIATVFTAHGVPEADFIKAFNSFGVSSEVTQATATAKAAKLTGTPALMVNGKYYIGAHEGVTQADLLKIADFLIAQERAAASK